MKREILCKECEVKARERYGEPPKVPYPGEHVKLVQGKALNGFMCDRCGEFIFKDEECCACSIWADYGGIPYYEWEHRYIRVE